MDAPIDQTEPAELLWRGVPRGPFERMAERLGAPQLLSRVVRWAD
jgi:hypothetical protein